MLHSLGLLAWGHLRIALLLICNQRQAASSLFWCMSSRQMPVASSSGEETPQVLKECLRMLQQAFQVCTRPAERSAQNLAERVVVQACSSRLDVC